MVTKWRPNCLNAIYVIPDIHGNLDGLNQILNRILPLRFSDGGTDRIVFLGDYLDRGQDSHLVLDRLIEVKKEFPDQVIFLKGNHESLFLRALNQEPGKNIDLCDQNASFRCWINNGGLDTIKGYVTRAGLDAESEEIDRIRIQGLIPKEHIEFLQTLDHYYEFENYWFVHGGCNPNIPLDRHDPYVLHWDRDLYKFVRKQVLAGEALDWEQVIICGHTPNVAHEPFIHSNFMMLDCGRGQLMALELRSMTAYIARDGHKMLGVELKETTAENIVEWNLNH